MNRYGAAAIWAAGVCAAGVSGSAGPAVAGDWREVARENGIAIAFDAAGMSRVGDALSLDMSVALMPERHMPVYSIMRVEVDCSTLSATLRGAQFYRANGDPFGAKQEDAAAEDFGGDGLLTKLCDGDIPSGPGVDNANAFFQTVQIKDD